MFMGTTTTKKAIRRARSLLHLSLVANATGNVHGFIDWTEEAATVLGLSFAGLSAEETLSALRSAVRGEAA